MDDEGSIKGLPRNLRASDIAHCCGKPLEVSQGAFACSGGSRHSRKLVLHGGGTEGGGMGTLCRVDMDW